MLDLELIITRTSEQTTASLRVELPSRRVDLADGVLLAIDEVSLRALSLMPDAYGAALTALVFPAVLREAWQQALGYAEGRDAPLRVRLHLRGDDALHTIRWELLRDPVTNTPLAYRERVCICQSKSGSPALSVKQASAHTGYNHRFAVLFWRTYRCSNRSSYHLARW